MAILTLKTERRVKAVGLRALIVANALNVASVLNARKDLSVASAAIVTVLKLWQVLPLLVW